jgi:hypothetical protein
MLSACRASGRAATGSAIASATTKSAIIPVKAHMIAFGLGSLSLVSMISFSF